MTQSIFKPLNDVFTNSAVCSAQAKCYGKMLKFKLMGRSIVMRNALLVSEQLKLKGGKYSTILEKLIRSCIANGVQIGLNSTRLYIKSFYVGPGTYLKRREFKGRGRSGQVWRAHSRLFIQLQQVDFEPRKQKSVNMEVLNGQ